MPSPVDLYNAEVLEGHREAVAKLRELLRKEENPIEIRKLANALLRARQVKPAPPEQPAPQPRRRATAPHQPAPAHDPLNDLDTDRDAALDEANDDFDDDGFEADDREADRIVRRALNESDPLGALRHLQAVMKTNADAVLTSPRAPESS